LPLGRAYELTASNHRGPRAESRPNQHAWFPDRPSRVARQELERDRYMFREGASVSERTVNNWESGIAGGLAWGVSSQTRRNHGPSGVPLHLAGAAQAHDLSWQNPREVRRQGLHPAA
jgi:hypothetical protein